MTSLPLDDNVIPAYRSVMQLDSKYAVLEIENNSKIVAKHVADFTNTKTKEEDRQCFQDMVSHLTSGRAYIIYTARYQEEGRPKSQEVMIFWCDGSLGTMDKLVFDTNRYTLTEKCEHLKEYNAKCKDDLSYDKMLATVG